MKEVDIKDWPVTHHFGGGVYTKQMGIPAGHVAVQHKHVYEHLSILASGMAWVNDTLIIGPTVIVIPANKHHRVEAITDCLWFCIHATEEKDATKIDEVLVMPSNREEMLKFLSIG